MGIGENGAHLPLLFEIEQKLNKKEVKMFIPLSFAIEDVQYVGSTVIDFLADLSILLYDVVNGVGLDTDVLSSVTSS